MQNTLLCYNFFVSAKGVFFSGKKVFWRVKIFWKKEAKLRKISYICMIEYFKEEKKF